MIGKLAGSGRFAGRTTVAAMSLLFACSTTAFAQLGTQPAQRPTDPRDVDPRRDARMHAGILYLTPSIEIKEIGVDTNVFNSATAAQSDFTATLVPTVDTWVPIQRRALLSGTLATDFVYYSKFSGERSVNPDLSVRGDVFLQKLSFFGEEALLSSRERPSFEIDARSRRSENRARIGVGYAVTSKTTIEFSAQRTTHDFDQDAQFFGTNLRTSLKRKSTGYDLTTRVKLTPKTSIVVDATSQKDRFDFSPAKNADRLRILPGLVFSPRALISGSFQIGFQRFRTLDAAVADYTGVLASTELGYKFGLQELTARWTRDVAYSFELTQPFYVSSGLGAKIRRQLVGRVDSVLSFDRYLYDYKGAKSVSVSRQDVTKNVTVDLGYRLNKSTRVGLGVTRWSRASTSQSQRDYRGWRIGATGTVGR